MALIIKIYEFFICKISFSIYAKRVGLKYGVGCRFINVSPHTFGSEPYLINIGDRVSLSEGVRFICHDGALWSVRHTRDDWVDIDYFSPIDIGDDVFIGMNVVILPGVSIGSGSIIAAGAVVATNVGDGMVYGGVPAKPLMTVDKYISKISGRKFLNTKRMSRNDKMKFILDNLQ